MPTGNQNQGRRGEGRQNGGMSEGHGARQTAENAARGAQQGLEQVGDRLREGYEAVSDRAARQYRQAEGTVARNPTTSVLVGFGLGLGLGLAISALIASEEEETWTEKYVPDSVRDMSHRLGKIRYRDVARQVPDWHETFGNLTETIKDLPSAIARMMPSR